MRTSEPKRRQVRSGHRIGRSMRRVADRRQQFKNVGSKGWASIDQVASKNDYLSKGELAVERAKRDKKWVD